MSCAIVAAKQYATQPKPIYLNIYISFQEVCELLDMWVTSGVHDKR